MRKNHFNLIKLAQISVDLLSILFFFLVFVCLRKLAGGEFAVACYSRLIPFLLVFWLVFEKTGLYQGCAIYSGASIGPVEEIRRTFYAISVIFLGLGFANYAYRPDGYSFSRTVFLCTYLACLFIVPFNRFLLRKVFTRLGWWGVSTVIIGSGKNAADIYKKLIQNPEYGLRPTGYFTNNESSANLMPEEVRRIGGLDEIHNYTRNSSVNYAIIAKDQIEPSYLRSIVKNYAADFAHILFIPQLKLDASAGITPKDINGILGLEIRQNLQIPSIYRIKRTIDFVLTIPCLILSVPLFIVIAIWIKLDSRGPVFFSQSRISKNGSTINIHKFRTMVADSGKVLEEILSDPAIKKEWDTYGKLKNDPRITRAGKWLRATSLDELPQFWNLLQGKLTLVGPRPIVQGEVDQYGDDVEVFNKVLPGITGLWQVSGRNELSYKERVRLDKYYVNNWSVWLDIYILAKTVIAVLFRKGAR